LRGFLVFQNGWLKPLASVSASVHPGWHAATLPTAKKIADALDATLAELVSDL
jgi:hypothetical protein